MLHRPLPESEVGSFSHKAWKVLSRKFGKLFPESLDNIFLITWKWCYIKVVCFTSLLEKVWKAFLRRKVRMLLLKSKFILQSLRSLGIIQNAWRDEPGSLERLFFVSYLSDPKASSTKLGKLLSRNFPKVL